MSSLNSTTMASVFDSFHFTDWWKKKPRCTEIKNHHEYSQIPSPTPTYKSPKILGDDIFVAAEAVEIIIEMIENVIGTQGDYIKELSQRWSNKILNLSFERLRQWRNLRYQGVCTISQRIPHQYVATTFSGDPASKGECSVKWHNGNISVMVMIRGYNKF